jgi:hypothetical protein
VIRRLDEFGWLSRTTARLPRKKDLEAWWRADGTRWHRKRLDGRPVVRVMLTDLGRKAIADAYRKHASYMRAEFRVLDGRQQETLSRFCQKLRKGDVIKFVREIMRKSWRKEIPPIEATGISELRFESASGCIE